MSFINFVKMFISAPVRRQAAHLSERRIFSRNQPGSGWFIPFENSAAVRPGIPGIPGSSQTIPG